MVVRAKFFDHICTFGTTKLKNNIYSMLQECFFTLCRMSLARITKRIEEQDTKKVKIDGRRFNKRSQQKMIWQVRDLQRGMIKKPHRTGRGSFSKDELEEYKLIKDKDREE